MSDTASTAPKSGNLGVTLATWLYILDAAGHGPAAGAVAVPGQNETAAAYGTLRTSGSGVYTLQSDAQVSDLLVELLADRVFGYTSVLNNVVQ